MIFSGTKSFLSRLVETLDLKSASFEADSKGGFCLLLINREGKGKEVHFGNEDDTRTSEELLNELIELVAAQGW